MGNPAQELGINNYLDLFTKEGDPIVERVTNLLAVSQRELAEAFGLSTDQIRPDRMSEVAKQRVKELAGTLEFVAEIFHGNKTKALFWIKTPNPHFGGVSPRDMIIRGRQKKIHSFVLAAMNRETSKLA